MDVLELHNRESSQGLTTVVKLVKESGWPLCGPLQPLVLQAKGSRSVPVVGPLTARNVMFWAYRGDTTLASMAPKQKCPRDANGYVPFFGLRSHLETVTDSTKCLYVC